jgi:hypothetical protein
VIEKGKELRNAYHQDRIKALQLANSKKDPDAIEKAFHSAQASKEMFWKVPSARPAISSGISSIKVPVDPLNYPKDSQTVFKSIVNPIEIEWHILQRNQIHFSQACHTPLATWAVSELLGFGGTRSVADRLLQGTVAVGQAILVQCKQVNSVLPAGISIDKFKAS